MSTESKKKCPYETAGFFSRLTYMWLLPLVLKGRRDGIKDADLFGCAREHTSDHLGESIEREWEKEISLYKCGEDPSLGAAILRVFAKPYIMVSFLPFIEECILKICQAVALGYLVKAVGSMEGGIPKEAYYFTVVVCLTSVLVLFTRHPFFIAVRNIGMQVRVACCTIVCKKAMNLSKAAMGETTVGQMVNLISNDVARFDQSVSYIPYIVISPIQTVIIVAILWKDLGPSCLAGVSVVLLYIPYQIYMGRILAKLRDKTAQKTDERICMTGEVVAGMKIIKMYCWEEAFRSIILRARKLEISCLLKSSLILGLNTALSVVFSKIILVICFVLYSYLGNSLTAEKVFVSLALFNHLRLGMTFYFANGITQLAETKASIKRLQTFLLLEEQQEMDQVERPKCRPLLPNCSVSVDAVSARWDCLVQHLTLENVTSKVRPGELLAIVGSVGSGKTSFLMALMGELQAEKGRIRVAGDVAYTSQEPWTFSGTVRQNIIFDKPFEIIKYRNVLQVCSLEKDIEQFDKGDLTLVGDKGASLSGGQRARISLARAVYADSDVYLLDDPLSAVDAAVGKQLFENCICGYLNSKVRVLVTHQVQFLKAATNILVLDKGKMVALGNYGALLKLGVDLISIEGEVQEERRNSLVFATRRQSSSRRSSIALRRLSTDRTPVPEVSFRRKSVIMSGMRNSINDRKRTGILKQETRKKSMVAAIFDRKKSLGKTVRERNASIISLEEMMPSRNTMEILPFGGIVDTTVDSNADEDSEESGHPEESTGTGSVGYGIYWKYLRSGGSILLVSAFLLAIVVRQAGINGSDYWLTIWINENECNKIQQKNLTGSCNEVYLKLKTFLINNLNVWYPDILRDGYIGLVGGILLLSFGVSIVFSVVSMRASINFHKWMFNSTLRSKVSFFDENPVGRILNRFSKDMGIADETLPIVFSETLSILLNLLGSVVLVIIINPWIAVPTCILAFIFVLLRNAFVGATRDIKRLEAVTRSPVYSTLATAMNGITVIRAFRSKDMFKQQFCKAQDNHTVTWFAFICVSQYFGMILDFLCAIYITAIAWLLVLLPSGSSGGNIGLALSSALVLSGTFQWGVRLSIEVENQMTSVERILEYSKLPSEGAAESDPDKKPPEDWPGKGRIMFDSIYLQYTPEGKHILRGFKCDVNSKEKIGIVGRTGAGKSSLMAALYRMVEPEGSVYIDDITTKDIGLRDLRSKISIIPQEPLIFTGSVRSNLDPYDEYPDPDIWSVLEQVHLKDVIRVLPKELHCQLTEGGAQLSLGQRQLFCLARAILKKNKILVMDEATANIDHKTDTLIQKLIKEVFKECTVLTIAHRLNTIIDYDKILVLDAGVAAEYEEPHVLLQRNGIFADMVKKTDWIMQRELQVKALRAYKRRHSDYRIRVSESDSHHSDEEIQLEPVKDENRHVPLSNESVIEESEEESEDKDNAHHRLPLGRKTSLFLADSVIEESTEDEEQEAYKNSNPVVERDTKL